MTSEHDHGAGAGGSDLYSYSLAGPASPSLEAIAFAPGLSLGAGLKTAREALRLTLDQVADATKIRRTYLASLESMDIASLPSRPFVLGYVRAYAQVLGLDEERALARFRQDAPDANEPLRAPVGVPKVSDPRFGILAVAASLVIAAIVIWNVAQRVLTEREPRPASQVIATVAEPEAGPVKLGAALPPPQESTIPDAYVTPGLFGPAVPPDDLAAKTGPVKAPMEPRRFEQKGAVYGVGADQSQIVFQAQRSVGLVARAADGKVYFAQQLKGGEAYRAPMMPGLLIDVSSPGAMDVFIGGALIGSLVAPVTPLSTIAKAGPVPVAPSAPTVQPTAVIPAAAAPSAAPPAGLASGR